MEVELRLAHAERTDSLMPKDDYIEVTDTLDLHGYPVDGVAEIVNAFIQNARELGLLSLKIIHGKGRSKLKHLVIRVLRSHPDVAGFCDAPTYTGGWGATILDLTHPTREQNDPE